MAAGHFLHALTSSPPPPGAQLVLVSTGERIATSIELAGDSAARKKGLLNRAGLDRNAALIIAPCSAVHTFGMRFSIDVIFVARDGRVLKVAPDVRPRRIAAAWGAFAAIEMMAGEAHRHGVSAGQLLAVSTTAGVALIDS